MDFVIVSNYPVGGMENWGLIIFHANTILRSTRNDDEDEEEEQSLSVDRLSEQYRIEKLITHEIIHQW